MLSQDINNYNYTISYPNSTISILHKQIHIFNFTKNPKFSNPKHYIQKKKKKKNPTKEQRNKFLQISHFFNYSKISKTCEQTYANRKQDRAARKGPRTVSCRSSRQSYTSNPLNIVARYPPDPPSSAV